MIHVRPCCLALTPSCRFRPFCKASRGFVPSALPTRSTRPFARAARSRTSQSSFSFYKPLIPVREVVEVEQNSVANSVVVQQFRFPKAGPFETRWQFESMCAFRTEHSALHDALVSYVQQYSSSSSEEEQYARFTCDDFCGVHYSVTYDKPAHADEGTVAIRTSWPWQLSSSLKLSERLGEMLRKGPSELKLSNATSRSAIVTWLLETRDGMTQERVEVAKWLSSLRCVHLRGLVRTLLTGLHSMPRRRHSCWCARQSLGRATPPRTCAGAGSVSWRIPCAQQ